DDIAHGWIVWVDRLDDREPTRMGPLHFHRITRVVTVHGKGGDEDRAVDADLVHRRHHLVTRDVIGPVRHTVPGSLRSVCLISVDLGIDDRHRTSIAKRFLYRNRCPLWVKSRHLRDSASFRVRHRTNVVMWTIANFVALEQFYRSIVLVERSNVGVL